MLMISKKTRILTVAAAISHGLAVGCLFFSGCSTLAWPGFETGLVESQNGCATYEYRQTAVETT
jgi:hypothetical protein